MVGGGGRDALAPSSPARAEVARNDAYGSGCASSLLAGLDAAGDVAAVMLLLGDMPGVEPALIDACASLGRATALGGGHRAPGRLGHSFVFSAAAFGDLRSLHGDKAVWKLIESHPERGSVSMSTASFRATSTRGGLRGGAQRLRRSAPARAGD